MVILVSTTWPSGRDMALYVVEDLLADTLQDCCNEVISALPAVGTGLAPKLLLPLEVGPTHRKASGSQR